MAVSGSAKALQASPNMQVKRIMLLGAGGQVGRALQAEHLPKDWSLAALPRAECDINNYKVVQQAIERIEPDLLINAAAMTAVDKCETDHKAAMTSNFEAPGNLAAQCASRDIPLIHLSTDYVFDGADGTRPYRTDDAMNPLSVYGHSKMMGEEAVRHSLAWHVILRVSSVFSAFGPNILTKALQSIEERDELRIVSDQISCPTYAPDVAKALIVMSDRILSGRSDGYGTFHLGGTPEASRFEFVNEVMASYASHTSRRPKIVAALSADFSGFAARPPYSVLDCSRINEIYEIKPKPWREGLTAAITALTQERRPSA
ncbi:MAG: dTDP-4-dehydrorhamnose reductase [Pseudomonadota bacterium]|nr:dTDP-4-dehydrorhamnose reductase [Pseudomonadota bacterium]